jgi:hypothetical protein
MQDKQWESICDLLWEGRALGDTTDLVTNVALAEEVKAILAATWLIVTKALRVEHCQPHR